MERLSPRQRIVLLVYGVLLAGLVPAYALLAPPSAFGDPVVLLSLVVLGVVAVCCEAALSERLALGSLPGVSLVAVALAGPLAALLVLGIALVTPALAGRERLLRVGNLPNAAAHGAYVLAAALVLDALGTGPLGLVAAAVAQLAVNFLVGPAVFNPLWLGRSWRDTARVLVRGVPSGIVVGAIAGATVLLWPSAGPGALALFAGAVIAPHATLAVLARRSHAARLSRPELCARYAGALALELGLDRAGRDRVDAVARLIARRRPTGSPIEYMVSTLTDRSPAARDAGHLTEWIDGTGGPAALQGGMIPTAARIVAVADTWAGLTAAGTVELSHAAAVHELRAEAGRRLDPEIVRVAERLALGLPPTLDPGAHSRWLPAAVRRRLLAALGPGAPETRAA